MEKLNTKKLKMEIANAKKKAKANFARAKAQLTQAEKKVVSFVDKNPRKAAAIAAGVGAAIGAAVAMAARRRK